MTAFFQHQGERETEGDSAAGPGQIDSLGSHREKLEQLAQEDPSTSFDSLRELYFGGKHDWTPEQQGDLVRYSWRFSATLPQETRQFAHDVIGQLSARSEFGDLERRLLTYGVELLVATSDKKELKRELANQLKASQNEAFKEELVQTALRKRPDLKASEIDPQ